MGGSQSSGKNNIVFMGQRKKIVIIGASFGGNIMTKMLQQIDQEEVFYEILLIDKNEHFEYICGNFEMLANPSSFGENSIKFSNAIESYNSSRVSFMQGKLTNVLAAQNLVEVTNPEGKVEQVSYDALVISSGASYVSPWRGQDKCLSMAERESEVKEIREKMKAASSILCVGAGPTGLETASYLKEYYPNKRIGICQRGQKLLPAFPNAHSVLMESFKKLDIKVITGKAFSEDDKMGYEYIVDCRGFKYLGPKDFMQGPMAECVEPKTG
jgi:NADH dehydrogenase FAD-containing subunit